MLRKFRLANIFLPSRSQQPIYIPITRLHKYVNSSHLPEELGGTWVYNHRLWISNRIVRIVALEYPSMNLRCISHSFGAHLQKVEGFVKLAENSVINLETLRHRLNNAKECLEHKIFDICAVNEETYDMARKSTSKTINVGECIASTNPNRSVD